MSWNDNVIDEFRTHNGKVGGMFEGAPMLLLTTAGRRTGKPHTTPTIYLHEGDRYYVFASNAGRDTDPDWFRNLLESSQVTVELGTDAGQVQPYAGRASVLERAERDQVWARQCAIDPSFLEYEAKTDREIPVVAVTLLSFAADPSRARAVAEQLGKLHDTLRGELAQVRERLAATPDGAQPAGAEADLLTQLRSHCLTYCYDLQMHHTREDGSFTAFEAQFPELIPAIARLREEHRVVEGLLQQFETVLHDADSDAAAVRAELERVAAGLEEHFDFEEKQLLAATEKGSQ